MLPELPDAAGGMFPGSLIGDHNKLHLISDLQDLPTLHLGHVEEQFLALVLLVGEESELT